MTSKTPSLRFLTVASLLAGTAVLAGCASPDPVTTRTTTSEQSSTMAPPPPTVYSTSSTTVRQTQP
jgi:hypothetical protein